MPPGTRGHIFSEEKQPANLITVAGGEEKRLLLNGGFLPVKPQAPGVPPDRAAHQPRLKLEVNGVLVELWLVRGDGSERGQCHLRQIQGLGDVRQLRLPGVGVTTPSLRDAAPMSGLLVSLSLLLSRVSTQLLFGGLCLGHNQRLF